MQFDLSLLFLLRILQWNFGNFWLFFFFVLLDNVRNFSCCFCSWNLYICKLCASCTSPPRINPPCTGPSRTRLSPANLSPANPLPAKYVLIYVTIDRSIDRVCEIYDHEQRIHLLFRFFFTVVHHPIVHHPVHHHGHHVQYVWTTLWLLAKKHKITFCHINCNFF